MRHPIPDPCRSSHSPAPGSALPFSVALATASPADAQIQEYGGGRAAVSRQPERTVRCSPGGRSDLCSRYPDEVLERDMIIMSRFAKGAARGLDRRRQYGAEHDSSMGAPRLIGFWCARSPIRTSPIENDAVAMAVEHSNFAPILHSLPIAARGSGTSVVDVTGLYMNDTPSFALPRQPPLAARRTQLRPRPQLARMGADSFPTNVEVRVVQTYAAGQAPSNSRGGTVSFEVNHSMVMLPEEPMMPRLWDERTG